MRGAAMWGMLFALAGCRQLLGLDEPTMSADAAAGSNRGSDAAHLGDGTPIDAPVVDAAGPAIRFVQSAGKDGPDGASVAVTLGTPTRSGDLVLVVVSWTTTGAIGTVTDSAGDTYAQLGPTVSRDMRSQVVWLAAGVAGGAATVSASFATAATTPELRVIEYAGLATTSDVIDRSALASGTTALMACSTMATTHPHELIVGIDTAEGTSAGGGPGLTVRESEGPDLIEDREVFQTGTYEVSATQDIAAPWILQQIALIGAP
jgi:hypothetical protein